MAGNTSDEFLNTIEAENGDQLKEKAEKLFGSKAGRFLSFPETGEKVPDQGYAPVSGIECTVKGVLSKTAQAGKKGYCYRFDPDMPGWDNPGLALPEWKPWSAEEPCTMRFEKDGAVPSAEPLTPFKQFLSDRIMERIDSI